MYQFPTSHSSIRLSCDRVILFQSFRCLLFSSVTSEIVVFNLVFEASSVMKENFPEYKATFDANPYHKWLGITVLDQSPTYGKIVLFKDENTPGGIGGSVHGGVLAAMVDIVMLVALFAEMREGEVPAGTAELSITYLRQTHGEHIYAEANVIKRGRQLSLVEVDITDDDGKLCARGRTLYAFRA